jgi:hypothetical protein
MLQGVTPVKSLRRSGLCFLPPALLDSDSGANVLCGFSHHALGTWAAVTMWLDEVEVFSLEEDDKSEDGDGAPGALSQVVDRGGCEGGCEGSRLLSSNWNSSNPICLDSPFA